MRDHDERNPHSPDGQRQPKMWIERRPEPFFCVGIRRVPGWNYGFSSEGAESWLKVSAGSTAASNQAVSLQLNQTTIPIGASNANVYYNTPTLDLQVVTAPNFADPSSVFIQWSISRTDTNAVIASKASRLSDPAGGTLSISRTTPALQAVTEFTISVTIFQPGVVTSYTIDLKVVDWLDRSHRFVKWTSHTWFADPKKPRQWIYYWERVRPSRIHRTDWPGRCRRLSPPASILPALMTHDWPTPLAKNKFWAQFVPEKWSYVDELPFTNAEDAISGRRGVLCDYCFFGGPTKTTLLVSVP
jgi:hypothetical protein